MKARWIPTTENAPMIYRSILMLLMATIVGISNDAHAQSPAAMRGESFDTPLTRMRPIGSPSAVDQYRQRQTVRQQSFTRNASTVLPAGGVRQTVMLQQSGMDLPPGGNPAGTANVPTFGTPMPGVPTTNAPMPGVPVTGTPAPTLPVQPTQLPVNPSGALPMNNNGGPINSSAGVPSNSDFLPMQQPQLRSGFANVDNCNCVSGPSSYRAASGYGCGSTLGYVAPQSYNAPPAQVPAPALMPQTFTPGTITPGAINPGVAIAPGTLAPGAAPVIGAQAPPRALVSLGQQNFPVQVGQGLWGQPVAYVPGQSIRNWVRYFFP